MSIEITDELVDHIARLSRLSLDDAESRAMGAHFRKILEYIAELAELDLEGIDPTLFALEDSNVERPDEVDASLPIERILPMAPESHAPYFVVPRIVGGHGGES